MVDTKSWRDVLPIHPAADLFPMMTPDELKALGEDIKKNRLHERVTLYGNFNAVETWQLLDGRNRLDAMELVGLPVFAANGEILAELWEFRPDYQVDPYEFVLSANIHRRHLTADQKRDLIAEVLKAAPRKSNRQIAKAVGVSHPHVGKIRTEMESAGDVETVTTSIDTKGRKQQVKKKHRDVDDYLAEKRAKKITETAAVLPTESERQFALLTTLWGMSNTLRAAWERSNQKAQRRFIRWLDGGARDEDENEVGGAAERRAGEPA
jgi:DNA-binding Lrp family transcriptional regulator